MDFLPRTWAPVYKDITPKLLTPPPPSDRAAAQPISESSVTFWTEWNNRKMLRYLMQLRPEPPRQTPETWREWTRVQLPDEDITFIQQALWRKLPVGTRLAGWQPRGTAYPLDGQQETIEHAAVLCRFLLVAFRLATQCMGPVQLDEGSTEDPEEMLLSMPTLSLSSPLGLVLWSPVRASWCLRCALKFDPQPQPPHWKHFLRLWMATLEPWLEHPTPTLPHSEVMMLLHGLQQLDGPDGVLDHPRANQPGSRPPPALHYPSRKKSRKQGHEAALREYFEAVIERYQKEGATSSSGMDRPRSTQQ